MLIEILKPIAGLGDYVKGSHREFSLDVGMQVEVEDYFAEHWISAGIAREPSAGGASPSAPYPAEAKESAMSPETAMLKTPERAVLPSPQPRQNQPKKHKGRR